MAVGTGGQTQRRMFVDVGSLLEVNSSCLFNIIVNTEQLIELVSANPLLSDLNRPKFIDVKLKEEIWDKIGGEWNQPCTNAFLYVVYV
jgi:hypothetical protein